MTEGYRKAALKLHGLNAADRNWMLQRLEPHEQAVLGGLLHELRELGIQPNQRISDDISDDEARHALLNACGKQAEIAHALDVISAAHSAEISALLSHEPDSMAAAVLSAYPWPWRARFLAEYGVEKRQRINRAMLRAPQLKPRLRAQLIQVLAERLETLRTQGFPFEEPAVDQRIKTARPSRPQSFWKGWRRWLP